MGDLFDKIEENDIILSIKMDIKDYLSSYASSAEKILADFFAKKTAAYSRLPSLIPEMFARYRKFTCQGKKSRGALAVLGYECFGEGKKRAILEASVALEIIHSFLLIHDDICDRAEKRRGKATIHRQYEDDFKLKGYPGDREHYGRSLALIAGDIGLFAAYDLLLKIKDFKKERLLAACSFFTESLLKTGLGQMLDIEKGHLPKSKITREDVSLIQELKTSHYSFVGPLGFGAILGGASPSSLGAIEEYGVPLGIAFQIQDDILGMFGKEKILGKSASSDLKENKNTLLILYAWEKASPSQRKLLEKIYGNPSASERQIEKIREVFRQTGALAFSENLARNLVAKGKKFVPKITSDKNLQEVLYTLADFVLEREK